MSNDNKSSNHSNDYLNTPKDFPFAAGSGGPRGYAGAGSYSDNHGNSTDNKARTLSVQKDGQQCTYKLTTPQWDMLTDDLINPYVLEAIRKGGPTGSRIATPNTDGGPLEKMAEVLETLNASCTPSRPKTANKSPQK